MLLSSALRLPNPPCLALVGAGGKTTALFQLARELALGAGHVIVTATTHLGAWQASLADRHFIVTGLSPHPEFEFQNASGVTLMTGPLDGDRFEGLEYSRLSWLRTLCESNNLPLLIEADGSRQRPLKAPAEHEPVIPDFVGTVVVFAGLSGLGKPLTDEFVHRPEIFARLSGLAPGKTVTPAALVCLLTHPSGGLKNIPSGATRVVLLNQADTPELQAQAKAMAEQLLSCYHAVVISSLNPQSPILNP